MPEPSQSVILLHGILRDSTSFRPMARRLEEAGYDVLGIDYPSRRLPLEKIIHVIHPMIAAWRASKPGKLNFVAHSMGGLVARAYINHYRPADLGRGVMLGTPNSGSEVADFMRRFPFYHAWFGPAGRQLTTQRDESLTALLGTVDYPLGIIAGDRFVDPISHRFILPRPNDGRVSVASTKLDGMADHLVLHATHPLMMRNPEVIRQTLCFLAHGQFQRKTPLAPPDP